MFDEIPKTQPKPLANYMGFTEEEVSNLCRKHNVDYEKKEKLYKAGKLKEKPKKPPNYDQLKEKIKSIKVRDHNSKEDGGPIMPLGAWHLPTSGATPTGLKHGLQIYRFKAK